MRDDVDKLFAQLIVQINHKTDQLDLLIFYEKNLGNTLKFSRDHEDEILKIIEDQSRLIDEIDSTDYSISCIKDKLKQIAKIDFDRIIQIRYKTDEPKIIEYREGSLKIFNLLDQFSAMRITNNEMMVALTEDIKSQADELMRMSRLKLFLPKDPRSS